jgi:hypothetical protein
LTSSREVSAAGFAPFVEFFSAYRSKSKSFFSAAI